MKNSDKLLIKYKIEKNISDEVTKFSNEVTKYFLSVGKEISKESNKGGLNKDKVKVRKKFNYR